MIPKNSGKIFCGLKRLFFFFFGRLESRYVQCKTNTTLNKKKIISTDKHGGGSVMVFAASGSGKLIEP